MRVFLKRPRWSLRILFAGLTAVCAALAYVAPFIERARRRDHALAALPGIGVHFEYPPEANGLDGADSQKLPRCPAILRWLLGSAVFAEVDALIYRQPADSERAIHPSALRHLKEFEQLADLVLGGMGDRLTDADLANLQPLTQLTSLDVSGTAITDAGLRNLIPLVNLESLKLNDTQVTGEGLAQLTGCSRLGQLELRNAPLSLNGIRAIEGFKGLWSLRFTSPPGGDEEAFRACGQLPELWGLEVDNANLSGGCLRHLVNLTDLRCLLIRDAKIAPVELSYLAQLKDLRTLDVSGTNLTDADIVALCDLRSLECLSLDNTAVCDDALPHLARLTQLRSLDLSGTAVSQAGLLHLRKLAHLKYVDLTETAAEGQSYAEMSQLLPNCYSP